MPNKSSRISATVPGAPRGCMRTLGGFPAHVAGPSGHAILAASARCRYSWAVPSPIEQLRAICRSPRPTSNFNRRTSLILRTDNLLAGKLILPFEGRLPAIVLSSAATCLWKSFRRSRTPFRDRPETVRLHPGTGVHLHPGILFEIIPEHRSESSRNRVHVPPESPRTTEAGHSKVKALPVIKEIAKVMTEVIRANVAKDAAVMTDDHGAYRALN